MTPAAFNKLSTEAQIRLALDQDTLIAQRGEGPRCRHLYAIENFYVEIIFTTRRKEVLWVHATADEAILDPYLQQIDLSKLLE